MTTADDLIDIADSASEVLQAMREPARTRELAALKRVSEEVASAWSGSNWGYHASVYTANLLPKPPNAQFNPEWGLMESWPIHQPDRIWTLFDGGVVQAEILRHAGPSDLFARREEITAFRKRLDALRENAISALTADGASNDSFLHRKLHEIEDIEGHDVVPVLKKMYKLSSFSRDSQAMTQGPQPAPHQTIMAIPFASKLVEDGLEQLEQACRDCARHLGRGKAATQEKVATGGAIFIGHGRSPLWRELKDFLDKRLGLRVIEFNHVSVAGVATTERLSEMLDDSSFAFLIMTAEDELVDGAMIARSNVIHEAGIFQGRLGFRRAIILLEDGCGEFSNIHGLGHIRFPAGKIKAAFEEVREVLEREGIIERKK
jgi:predicted nucleotide-binding protein